MKHNKTENLCIFAGCLLALFFIVFIFSPENIDPLNINWVTRGGGDNLQHYLGWRFYKNNSWNRYLFFMRNLNYPIGTSVIVTDSNPLFSFIFKMFRDVLPVKFQFNGIWIIFSYLAIAFLSAKIGWRLTENALLTMVCVLFAILNPVILQRAIIHDTLTAHWLILAAIWLCLNQEKKWNLPGWFILTELALLIHIYFIPMIGFIFLFQIIRMVIAKSKFIHIFSLILVFCAALLVGYFVFGYVYIAPQTGSYGELSMNLNAFINPDSIPALLKARPKQSLQYEGFNYYGLGMLVFIGLAVIFVEKNRMKSGIPYMLPVIGLILISVSNNAYFDDKCIYRFDLPENIYSALSVFRSSGRLVWPLYYIALFAGIYLVNKKMTSSGNKTRKMFLEIMTIVCGIIQIVDLNQFHQNTAERFRNPANDLIELPNEFSHLIPDNATHLYCSDGDSRTIDSLALFAADKNMTFNKCANARGIRHIYGGDEFEPEKINCQSIQSDSVYIFLSKELFPSVLKACEGIRITELSDWIIVTE